ncbi:MAG: DUF2892 domain-containing protein [Solirubrobacterales bacterium]
MNEKTWNDRWPAQRVLFLIAGAIVLTASILAAAVSPWFLLLTGFVALNQLLYASAGFCGASLILARFTRLKPACALTEERS